MKKILTLIPLFLLVITLFQGTYAGDDIPTSFLGIGITSPVDGQVVNGIVEVNGIALGTYPIKGHGLKGPIQFTVHGESHGLIVIRPDCETTEEGRHVECSFNWNTRDFRGETVRISAHASDVEGTEGNTSIVVKVREAKKHSIRL